MDYIKVDGENKDVDLIRESMNGRREIVGKLFLETVYDENNVDILYHNYWIYDVKKDTYIGEDYEGATKYFGDIRLLTPRVAVPEKYRNVDLYKSLRENGLTKKF